MTGWRELLWLLVGGAIGALAAATLSGGGPGPRTTREEVAPPAPETVIVPRLRAEIRRLQTRLEAAELQREPESEAVQDSPEEIQQLVESAYADTDVDALLEAIRRLLRMGPRGYPMLRQLLMDLFFRARMLASRADFRFDHLYKLTHIGMRYEEKLIGFLNYLLTDDDTPGLMRQGAAVFAAYFVGSGAPGSEELRQTLLAMLVNDATGSMAPSMLGPIGKRFQLWTMAMSGDPRMIGPLREELQSTKDRKLQGDILGALAYLGDPESVPLIEQRLDPAEGDFGREIRALGRIGTPEAHQVATGFLRAIPDTARFFRHAGTYLQNGGGTDAVLLMQERVRAEPGNPEVGRLVGRLQRFPTPESKQTLDLIAETTPDEQIKGRALKAAAEVDKRLRGEIPKLPGERPGR
ncbi:MAG: HEAT repeat domain-containing protein [Planctomycetota bacterium]